MPSYTDIVDRIYTQLVASTLTMAEIEQEMIAAAVRAGASPSYAKQVVRNYLDA
jgi:hypothetical protein